MQHIERYRVKKEELTKLLEEIKLSKKEFARLCNISYNTVNNWTDETRPVPPWVPSWLENYIKAKTLDTVVEAITPHIS